MTGSPKKDIRSQTAGIERNRITPPEGRFSMPSPSYLLRASDVGRLDQSHKSWLWAERPIVHGKMGSGTGRPENHTNDYDQCLEFG